MTNTVLIKRSGTANAIPTAGQLSLGELAINYNDGNLFYKNAGGTVTLLTSNQFVSVAGNVTGGNILTSGLISATGNVTVGNISATIGAFTTFTSAQGGNVLGTLIATSANAQFINQTNAAGYATIAGYLSAAGNITGGNILTGGLISATGNITGGNLVTGGLATVTGNVTGGNIRTGGQVSATANITGGNILTVGQMSATGTISTFGSTLGTGFAVGNGAVSNVALGLFPTAGTPGDYAIRDYSTVTGSMYFDMGIGGTAAGSFQFRTTNAFTQLAVINSSGINTPLAVSATGNVTGGNLNATGSVYGVELWSTNSVGSEGGQINLAVPASGSTISGGVIIDVYNNQLRFYERTGTNRGAYIDITAATAGVGSNLLAGGSSSTPTQIVNGTSNVVVTSSGNITANVAGAWAASFYANGIIANTVWANNNGSGTNFRVGDDAWIGDVNNADTISIRGLQNAANGYIVFGNADNSTTLGRAGSGPLTYLGAFSAAGNITGGNIATAGLITATGNIIGNRIAVAAGTAAAPSVQFSNDISADTGFYWISDGNIGVTTNGTLRATFLDTGLSVVGNTTSGNMLTGGLISATGNITGGNVITGGAISAASVSASGNVTGGNLITAAAVSAASVSASANITGGNLITAAAVSAASVSASGNVTGGNIIGTTAVVVPTVRNTAALTISTSAGDLNLEPTGNIVVNSKYINGVSDPVQNQDVATKAYVDLYVTSGISYHQPVAAATTTTLATTTGGTITYTQPNGAGNGVGALLTTTGSFNLIDTANVQTLGTRILVKNEANAVYNGVYTWANATNIVRSTDADEYGPDSTVALSINDYFYTTGGNVNLGTAFIVSAPTGTITFGTSNITFSTFATSQIYTANTAAGVSLIGTVINAKVDNTTTAFDGLGNISVKASATLTTPNIGAATGTSLSVTGNVSGGNLNVSGVIVDSTGNLELQSTVTNGNINLTPAGTGIVGVATSLSVTGNITGGNILGGANVNATTHTGTTVSVTGNITGNYFIGNGSQLTGISSSTSKIFNGTSEANIGTSGGNANITIAGTSNVAVFTTTGLNITGVVSASGNITGGNVLGGANVNATTHTGTTVSVTGNITGGNLNAAGLSLSSNVVSALNVTANIAGGNITTPGLVSATGNVTGGNLITVGLASITGNVNIGNATGVTWANATGVRVWTYYNNATASLDTLFL